MASNFDYLNKDAKYRELAAVCREAERAFAVSYSAAALQSRRALEIAVKWVYRHDADLEVPYRENLSALVHDYQFKQLVDAKLFPRLRFIIQLGNKAAHEVTPVRREQAVQALRDLFEFISWIDFSYSTEIHTARFDPALLPDGEALEKKTRKMQQELAAKEAAWQKQIERLENQLRSAEERAQTATQRKQNQTARTFAAADLNEAETRRLYIDLALENAGWVIDKNCLREVKVDGMPGKSGKGAVDYVLFGDDGRPLAVVEAKRTSKDAKLGKVQAKLYADCLEKQHGRRPLIFYTNGFETWFWEDNFYPERKVAGFFTKAELDWIFHRAGQRKSLQAPEARDDIAGRPYQKRAIQAVCEALQKRQRKALLVMATGSGKTRTAISLVEVLMRKGWVKRTLFLADRRELVRQAKKSFAALLPELSICNLLEEKVEVESRMVFSTYPTMMNAIDAARTKDGRRLFTPAHFDLIIVDESHRSIYKKYGDIFDYFDGILLGLTATPKKDVGKNTYRIFDLEDEVPTFAYELGEAVKDGYLVPHHSVETQIKFVEAGIHYDDLPEAEKELWEETFDDDVRDIAETEINDSLFNDSTIDIVLRDLMEKGIHVEGGETVGKTIIFAKNTRHADFILRRFDALYPEFAGSLMDKIYNGISHVDTLMENFSSKDKPPRIAVSVDMLDTGVDIPEIVNLVFFKKVRSKAKFWQMVGRGTRLCKELFGPGIDKDSFRIFDYCSNFEYFRVNPNGVEAKMTQSLTEKLFKIRVQIAQRLQHLDFQAEAYQKHRAELVERLFGLVRGVDENHFSARLRLEFVHRYQKREAWDNITDRMIRELEEQIAPLLIPGDEHESAKRFDHLLYAIELAHLLGRPVETLALKVIETAERLAEKGNLPQVQKRAGLIRAVREAAFWQEADLAAYEKVRRELRDLLVLLDKQDLKFYYTAFTDEVLRVRDVPGEYASGEFQTYRRKVDHYLREHQNDIVVHKLRRNQPLTESDFAHLEKLLWQDLGTREDYRRAFGDAPLLQLVAGLVGLERSAAEALFAEFISDQTLNSDQLEFVTLIVDHIVENGGLDKTVLNESPFNRYGSILTLFDGRLGTVQEIVRKIDEVNDRLALIG